MGYRLTRRALVIEVLLLTTLGATAASIPAFAVETHQFEVPAEDAASAIRDFATQAHVQILVAGENVAEKHLHSVFGLYSTDQGLRLLLADSGLSARYVGERSIALTSATPTTLEGGASSSSSLEPARVAQTEPSAPARSSSLSPNSAATSDTTTKQELSEVIVTAEKKYERLQDVPVPVSVVDTGKLTDSNQVLLRDYYQTVPGLSLTPGQAGSQSLSLRGITTGDFGNPTVAVLVDDVPYGGSTNSLGSNLIPDLDPGDLERIEVLRGPQGTLFGASSMGGLLKYVTRDPSNEGFSGRVEAGTSSVYNGAEPGFTVRASANVPVTDTLAFRASGFRRQDPGYIDNPQLNQRGVNEAQADGSRLAIRWRPSEQLSIKMSALYQQIRGNGSAEIDATLLPSLQLNAVSGAGTYSRRDQAYSAIIDYKIGAFTITSLTGYNSFRYRGSTDYTAFIGGAGSPTATLFGVTGAQVIDNDSLNKFSQELRLSTTFGDRIEWLLGGFYTHEHGPNYETLDATDAVTGQFAGRWVTFDFPKTYQEYAAFTDLTCKFSERFDVQVGGRESRNRETDNETDTGPFLTQILGGDSEITRDAPLHSSGSVFTYLVTPRFRLSSDLMLYARFASGYQAGGPNPGAPGAPLSYAPDKTQNYELGVKGDFLDHRLSVDASVYYINWNNIQILLAVPTGQEYQANGGRAKSEGVEFSVASRPLTGLELSAWVAYDHAVLTEDFPANTTAYGFSGDHLPNTPRFSGHVSAEQDFPLWTDARGFVGAQASYVGDRQSIFAATYTDSPDRQRFPSYTKTDLRAGVKSDSWTVNLFANNVGNVRGQLNGGLGYSYPANFIYIQPRTVGVNIARTF